MVWTPRCFGYPPPVNLIFPPDVSYYKSYVEVLGKLCSQEFGQFAKTNKQKATEDLRQSASCKTEHQSEWINVQIQSVQSINYSVLFVFKISKYIFRINY